MKLVLHAPALKGKTIVLRGIQFTNGVANIPGNLIQNEGLAIYMGRCYQAYPEGMTKEEGEEYASQVPASALGNTPKEIPGSGEPAGAQPAQEGSTQQPGNGDPSGGGAQRDSGGSGQEDPRLHTRLIAALNSLDPKDDSHWTKGGAPAISAVEKALGSGGVTRKEIEAAIPGFSREIAGGKPPAETEENT